MEKDMAKFINGLQFHHIGVAAKSIEKEFTIYSLMGYTFEGESFADAEQGIRGQFITAYNFPRLELLENLDGSDTLTKQLAINSKMYHIAFYADDFDRTIEFFLHNRAKIISAPKQSVYFGKRICFLLLRNMQMVELLEK